MSSRNGQKSRCPEKYARQETLEEKFTGMLKGMALPPDLLELARHALLQSRVDNQAFHQEAISRLQAEYDRLQTRLNAMYVDKLDGKISSDFFDRKATEWRAEQSGVLHHIEEHQSANEQYMEQGVNLLELVSRAHELFEKQEAREKRRLLHFVLSNRTWKGGELKPQFRQPFDLIADAARLARKPVRCKRPNEGGNEEWLPARNPLHNLAARISESRFADGFELGILWLTAEKKLTIQMVADAQCGHKRQSGGEDGDATASPGIDPQAVAARAGKDALRLA